MFRKFLYLVVLVFTFAISGCSSIVFDQNSGSALSSEEEFNRKLNGFKEDFSMRNAKKDYETNRIFSNDFPITYRAKQKKKF